MLLLKISMWTNTILKQSFFRVMTLTKIIRVKSDHGNEFGIRLDKGQKLQNGSAFLSMITMS